MDQIMGITKSDQRIKVNNNNQGMGWIKSSKDIQLWHLVRFSIMTDCVTLNCDTQSWNSNMPGDSLWGINQNTNIK